MDLRSQKRRSFLAQHAGASSVSLGRTASKHAAAYPQPRNASSYSSLHAHASQHDVPEEDPHQPSSVSGQSLHSPQSHSQLGWDHADRPVDRPADRGAAANRPATAAEMPAQPKYPPQHDLKLVCVGDGGCGKTSLLTRFVRGTFPENYVPTVFDNYVKQVLSGNETVELALWDTAGQEEYDRLRVLSYAETQVFLVCYAVDNYVSLENVTDRWLPEIKLYCPDVPFLLVALKADRAKETQVLAFEQGSQVAQKHGAYAHVECSAREGVNVDQVFEMAIEAVLGRPAPEQSPEQKQSIRPVQAEATASGQTGTAPGKVPGKAPGTAVGRPGPAHNNQPQVKQSRRRDKHRCVII